MPVGTAEGTSVNEYYHRMCLRFIKTTWLNKHPFRPVIQPYYFMGSVSDRLIKVYIDFVYFCDF